MLVFFDKDKFSSIQDDVHCLCSMTLFILLHSYKIMCQGESTLPSNTCIHFNRFSFFKISA